jgi:hypothetical protein
VSAEHWLDNLARRYSRRTILKAAVAGGVSLTLPQVRIPLGRAAGNEPCYKPCIAAADQRFHDGRFTCAASNWASLFPGAGYGLINGQVVTSAALTLVGIASTAGCMAGAELRMHRDIVACSGSECGNPSKYPKGAAPGQANNTQCDPTTHVVCGDACCKIGDSTCTQCKDGTYKCCANTEAQSCC